MIWNYTGNIKPRFHFEAIKRLSSQPDGKLVLVTAITPTPAGEGKTLTTIGLAQALNYMGHKTMVALNLLWARCSALKAVRPAAVILGTSYGRYQPPFYR